MLLVNGSAHLSRVVERGGSVIGECRQTGYFNQPSASTVLEAKIKHTERDRGRTLTVQINQWVCRLLIIIGLLHGFAVLIFLNCGEQNNLSSHGNAYVKNKGDMRYQT